jgi:hypothetical protein
MSQTEDTSQQCKPLVGSLTQTGSTSTGATTIHKKIKEQYKRQNNAKS